MLKYPNKSHRKIINIPEESWDLAELLGIVMGDGGINNDWQLSITLNSIADLGYSKYVKSLLERLFSIEVSVRKRSNENALVLICSSVNLLEFLLSKGAVKGHKIRQQIDAPDWVMRNEEYKKAFVRGLMDTDGCLYIHKHFVGGREYSNLGLCFTTLSSRLMNSVTEIFKDFGIKPYVTQNGTRLYLYSRKAVAMYLQIFGSSNPRITNKHKEWKIANLSYILGEVA